MRANRARPKMVARWHASGAPVPKEAGAVAVMERTFTPPKPLPDLTHVDAAKWHISDHAAERMQARNIGYWEVIAALEFPDIVIRGHPDDPTASTAMRGDVQVVWNVLTGRVITVASQNDDHIERKPLLPGEPMAIADIISPEVKAALLSAVQPEERPMPQIPAQTLITSKNCWDDFKTKHKPGYTFHYSEFVQAYEHTGISAGALTQVLTRVRRLGEVGNYADVPNLNVGHWQILDGLRQPEWLIKEQATRPTPPEEAGDTNPPAESPTPPPPPDSPSEDTITTDPAPAVTPTQILVRQDGTPHEQVGAVMDALKQMLRKEKIDFNYNESKAGLSINIPFAEEE